MAGGVDAGLRVIGYRHSVYSRAVRIGLVELGLACDWVEADPFAGPVAGHPFGRVPVLEHGAVSIYETWAILVYLRAQWGGGAPSDALIQAREAQVAGMVSAYAYWPLVRQVYAKAVFAPAMGEPGDAAEVAAGEAAAGPVLIAFEAIAAEGLVLRPTGGSGGGSGGCGPADWLLFSMLDAYARAPGAQERLVGLPCLGAWWQAMAARPGIAGTFAPLKQGG